MLCGFLPFDDDANNPDSANVNMLYKYIIKCCGGEEGLKLQYPEWVSADAKDLCNKILVVDPHERYNIREILAHRWMVPVASYIEKVAVEPATSANAQSS